MQSECIVRAGLRAQGGFSAVAGLFFFLSACSPRFALDPPIPPTFKTGASQRYDVIIVGAGMAGLTAARTLKHAGRTFIVLEATDRIGGRAISDATTFSAPIDLGGSWIHEAPTNPLTPIILGHGYSTRYTEVDASRHFFLDHRFASERERDRYRRIDEAYEFSLRARTRDGAASEHLPKMEPAGVAPSPAAGEVTFEELRALVALNAGPLESGLALESISSVDASDFAAGRDALVERGYGTFVEEYGEEVLPDVRLRSPVTTIVRNGGRVVVETSDGERFEGRRALVTVSIGVLLAGKIAFEPELPSDTVEAMRGLRMGLLDKVVLEFDTPEVFPRDDGQSLDDTWVLYGGEGEDPDDDMAFVLRPMRKNIAIGFFGGDQASALEELPDHGKEEMIRRATSAMSDMCKCDAARSLVKARATAWGANEWTLGAYSAALPGKAKAREVLATPVDHLLYFAGEACYNSTYNGSFAAAYSSALKASYLMIGCLRREDRGERCASGGVAGEH